MTIEGTPIEAQIIASVIFVVSVVTLPRFELPLALSVALSLVASIAAHRLTRWLYHRSR